MKTEFQGKYYHDVSSKPYMCEVRLKEDSISIDVMDEWGGGIAESIVWELSKISKTYSQGKHKIRLKCSEQPLQIIEVVDKKFAVSLHNLYPHNTFAKRDTFASRSWITIISILISVVVLGIIGFKVIIPNIAGYAATKVPLSIEQQIGQAAYEQLTSKGVEDTEKSRLVQEFFETMKLDGTYSYKISVLSSKTVNAFAVPGGRIVVYDGIIEEIGTSEELAALLAHESSHIELRHSLQSIFRSLSGYIVISLLFGDAGGGLISAVLNNLYIFQDLQYSRDMEREADLRGLKCMQNAGVNPKGMLDLFHSLEKHPSSVIEEYDISEFVSTHPLTKHRIEYIQKYVQEDPKVYQNNPKLDSLFYLIKK